MCLCAFLLCVPIFSTAKNKQKRKKYEKLDCCVVALMICVVITSSHLTKFIEKPGGWKLKMGNNQKAAVL